MSPDPHCHTEDETNGSLSLELSNQVRLDYIAASTLATFTIETVAVSAM
jgi:hypothetical protein